MYDFIRGKLAQKGPLHAVIDCNGVGYRLHIPLSAAAKLPALNEEVQLHTALIVRETDHSLYGFLTPSDRELFHTLCNISGVGPKTALGLIGHLSTTALAEAVAHNNTALISKVPGIGKKTAERLLIELRDKLPATGSALPPTVRDAMSALLNLGYSQVKAQSAVQKVLKTDPSCDLSGLITSALKHL